MRRATMLTTLALGLAASTWGQDAAFGDAFWRHWGDGRGEVASYELVYPRYGELRAGTAVAIFVTETLSRADRVKADRPVPPADRLPVMKLNLVEDFPTGIYDYNMMTSVFVGLVENVGRPPGSPAKVSFSSQEWCGHVYQQLLPDRSGIRHDSHSYFGGEGDQREILDYPDDGILEDTLWHWARGLAQPFLEAGERRRLPILTSAQTVRLRHQPARWSKAVLRRGDAVESVEVPAGTFTADVRTVEIEGGRTWTFHVERAAPHRILRWTTSDGQKAELVRSQRMPYWQLNGNADVEALGAIGLEARPERTP